VQNAAVAAVLDLDRGVDAAGGDEVDLFAVDPAGCDFRSLSWLEGVVEGESDLLVMR
jgi:hypothetical protein